MDRSLEFFEIVKNFNLKYLKENKNNKKIFSYDYKKPKYSPSPFILQSSDMLIQLIEMEKKRENSVEYYLRFHRKNNQNEMIKMKQIDQEMTLFAITWTTDVNELKRNYSNDILNQRNSQSTEHFSAVISYLLTRLQRFTKSLQQMKSLHNRFSLSPYKIHSSSSHSSNQSSSILSISNDISPPNTSSSNTSSFTSSTSSQSNNTNNTNSTFSERYNSEIAAPIKMKEYQEFATKYRNELLFESKQMTIKYHEDLQEASQMETTITSLYSMMNEFINVLQLQEENVIDIHETSKKTTNYVKETDKELLLTIERSKSYQMTIVSLIIGLSIFLLVLDYLTP